MKSRHNKTELYNAIGPAINASGPPKNIPTNVSAPCCDCSACPEAHNAARTKLPNNTKQTFTRRRLACVTSSNFGCFTLVTRYTSILANRDIPQNTIIGFYCEEVTLGHKRLVNEQAQCAEVSSIMI